MVEDDDFSLAPKKIERPASVPSRFDPQDFSKRDQQRRPKRPPRESKDYFRTLAKATESSNAQLMKQKSRYRFCVYQKGGEVYIDVVVLDENGKIKEGKTRRITHESFERWIEDLSAIEGLFLDQRA